MRDQWKKKTNRRPKKKKQKTKTKNKQTNTSEPSKRHAEQTNLRMRERRRACVLQQARVAGTRKHNAREKTEGGGTEP
jgi:hypothetical protein